MKLQGVMILGFLMVGSISQASLCKKVVDNVENEIVLRIPGYSFSEIEFWLWPSRKAISFSSQPYEEGKIQIQFKNMQTGEVSSSETDEFYVFSNNHLDYLECINQGVEASRRGKSLRVSIKNSDAGFYDHDNGCEGKSWAAFMGEDDFLRLTCEIID